MLLDTKQPTIPDLASTQPVKGEKKWFRRVLRPGALFLIFTIWGFIHYSRGSFTFENRKDGHSSSPKEDDEFKWENINPTKSLVYHPCFEGHQCARLEVPMDYNRTDGQGATVAVAIIRRPAKVPVTDLRYGGPVILNPGGPGGSGVQLVLISGEKLQNIVDFEELPEENPALHSEDAKYFDILSFDPRGINNTTPVFSCFKSPEERKVWQLHTEAEGNIASSDVAFDTLWARSQAFSQTCNIPGAEVLNGSEWIGHFMNTPTVVADMVQIIERHGEWREKETDRLSKQRCRFSMTKTDSKTGMNEIRLKNRWQRDEEKILYWGFSYGSVLGTTFAALQPNRIHRLIVDGVVDVYDFYEGTWLANLQDADAALGKFFEYCHEAGASECSFASSDLKDIQGRFQDVLEGLKTNPVAVPSSKDRGAEIVTYSDVNKLVMTSLYKPVQLFPLVAQVFTDLSQGNGSSFADYKFEQRNDLKATNNLMEAQASVICSDGYKLLGMTKAQYRNHSEIIQGQSQILGEEWPALGMACPGWTTRPAWSFDGRLNLKTWVLSKISPR
ncbi:proteinase [Penicillium angulare]|uniref:Proteinase n=1 Tax=Penicillium angulare TaxID=116970 RepID=A0A9W9FZX0_9EURO|nr:proteinase [Penicillium angulare]